MKLLKPLLLLLVYSLFVSCSFSSTEKETVATTEGYFEGEITLTETRGVYGSLFKVNTTFWIAENSLKREQKLGGLNSLFNTYAGILIDLEKDSVTLYYADMLSKNKHTTSLQEYQAWISQNAVPQATPSPTDQTFQYLTRYVPAKIVEDSVVLQGYNADYTLYIEEIIQQEVFDTKDLKIKRQLLEVAFPGIPQEINFPLATEFKTVIATVKNDSIINSDAVGLLDELAGEAFGNRHADSSEATIEPPKQEENAVANLALDALKKGVELAVRVGSKVSKLVSRKLSGEEQVLPEEDFEELESIEAFFAAIPRGEGFDD